MSLEGETLQDIDVLANAKDNQPIETGAWDYYDISVFEAIYESKKSKKVSGFASSKNPRSSLNSDDIVDAYKKILPPIGYHGEPTPQERKEEPIQTVQKDSTKDMALESKGTVWIATEVLDEILVEAHSISRNLNSIYSCLRKQIEDNKHLIKDNKSLIDDVIYYIKEEAQKQDDKRKELAAILDKVYDNQKSEQEIFAYYKNSIREILHDLEAKQKILEQKIFQLGERLKRDREVATYQIRKELAAIKADLVSNSYRQQSPSPSVDYTKRLDSLERSLVEIAEKLDNLSSKIELSNHEARASKEQHNSNLKPLELNTTSEKRKGNRTATMLLWFCGILVFMILLLSET